MKGRALEEAIPLVQLDDSVREISSSPWVVHSPLA